MARLRLAKVKGGNSRSRQGRERSGHVRCNWKEAPSWGNRNTCLREVGRNARRRTHTQRGPHLHCQHANNGTITGSSFPPAVTPPPPANSGSLTPASFRNSERIALKLLPLPSSSVQFLRFLPGGAHWRRPAGRVKVPPRGTASAVWGTRCGPVCVSVR